MDSIGALLAERARFDPELEAQVDIASGKRSTFADLDQASNRIAGVLGEYVRKGDRVALLMNNNARYAEVLFGVARLGAILVPLNWRLTQSELDYQIDDCEPVILVHDPDNAAMAAKLVQAHPKLTLMETGTASSALDTRMVQRPVGPPSVEVGRDDGFLILYTSGTTGKPKGVLHTHGSSLAWSQSTLATYENRLGDRQLLVSPLFHIAAICVLINAVHRGFTLVITSRFDPDEVWRLIEAEHITSMFAVPTMINMMRESKTLEKHRHDTLRWIMCGAAPVPVTLIDAYAELGIDIHQVYGSTEVHGGIAVLSPAYAHTRKGTTGRACLGVEIRVVDAQGDELPAGERGELVTRGANLFREYWNLPEATHDAFKDGWFYLGDIGEMDTDGFITIRDRSKDMIISGAENVYPAEIEDVLMRNSGVLEAAVVGEPHPRWGEQAVAFVVRRSGTQDATSWIADLEALCQANLASYKRPRRYFIVDQLPRNASGKLLKHILREQLAAGRVET